MSPGASDRHDWNDWENYQHVHAQYIQQFLGHFLLEDRLSFTVTRTQVRWKGELLCQGGLEIHITKLQDVRIFHGRPQVRTREYSYHVLQRVGGRTIPIVRYDNVHAHPEHPTAHHRHIFDEQGTGRIEHVGEEGWPTLSDVLKETYEWWRAHHSQ